ncbi:MAG: zinc ribbon domain-containing protein [Candidatus Ratteibacteria bacterium]|jgi:hypothetical protein
MICPHCGHKNEEGIRFCTGCGELLSKRARGRTAEKPTAGTSTTRTPVWIQSVIGKGFLLFLAVIVVFVLISITLAIHRASHRSVPPVIPSSSLPGSPVSSNELPQTPNESSKTIPIVNVSGTWKGIYTYQDTSLIPHTNEYELKICQSGPEFTGTFTEPNPLKDFSKLSMRKGIIKGTITGRQIVFEKRYTNLESSPVAYAGTVNMDGTIAEGRWNIPNGPGNTWTATKVSKPSPPPIPSSSKAAETKPAVTQPKQQKEKVIDKPALMDQNLDRFINLPAKTETEFKKFKEAAAWQMMQKIGLNIPFDQICRKAEDANKNHDWQKVIDLYTEALKTYPYYDASFRIANSYNQLNQPDKALG